jgi:eukaryotic-like serine/threonine-protein kinase
MIGTDPEREKHREMAAKMAAIGTSLPPRYTELETIAHGGMADVFRARDEILGRVVAVKVLSERCARNEEFHARFLREARTAASLSGERFVIAIYDVGETVDGLPYIVMENAPGGTVADRLRGGRPEPGLALSWLEQAASALDTAHARGIVHRDVKPANFLLAADETVRVSDFGIARAAGYDTLTVAGTVLGSAGYMAPEQARGEPSTAATDRYALACVAFEIFTGRRPFERESVTAEATAHVNERPPRVLAIDPRLPPELDLVFHRGLAKLPHDRFASCRALVANLRRAIAFGVAGKIVADEPSPPVVRRSGLPRGVAVAGAVALLAGGGLLAWALADPGKDSETPTVVLTETLQAETVVRTVTTEGETVERTVTSEVVVTEPDLTAPDATTTPPPLPPPPAPSGESGRSLNDRGFALLQQGNATGALPVLEEAVSKLRGESSITEAYASYNLAWARFSTGSCDGVTQLLNHSESIQGARREINRLREQVEQRCAEN